MEPRDEWRRDEEGRDQERLTPERWDDLRAQAQMSPEDREHFLDKTEFAAGFPQLTSLAKTALIAGGAYVGLRNFPSAAVRKSVRQFEEILLSLTSGQGRQKLMQRLQNSKALSPATAAQTPFRDRELAKDLDTAVRIFSSQSPYIGNKDTVASALFERYASKHPANVPLPAAYPQQVRDLANMPAFRESLARLGLNVGDVARRMATQAVQGPPRGIRDVLQLAGSIRFPFTNWRPLELLMPTELIYRQPVLGELSRQGVTRKPSAVIRSPLEGPPPRGRPESLFIGGAIHPVTQVGKHWRISDTPTETGMLLGHVRRYEGTLTGGARGAAARLGLTTALPLDQILEKAKTLGTPLPPGTSPFKVFKQPLTRADQITRFMLEVGEKTGIGPQYAGLRTERWGRLGQIYRTLKAGALGTQTKFLNVQPQRHGITPEGEFLGKILAGIGTKKVGTVTGPKDLSWFERFLLKVGTEPERVTARAGFAGEVREKTPIAKILDSAGKTIHEQYTFAKSSALRGEYYAFKSTRQGLSDWANYQIARPTWLLEEMTGLGMRPGKTPAQTLWNLGTKVALPAYLGWEALQYVEYKSKKHFGYGPISGAAQLYAEGRVLAQQVLDSAGITDVAKSIEEQFPGAIDSPFSKAAAAIGATFGGGALGQRLAGNRGGVAGLAAGLGAGLLFASGVSTNAQDLKEIYQGDQLVPVRADRWWTMGRQPWKGSRIKYWKKHWIAESMTDYRDKAIYGSTKESWRSSWLPVPENWFLLKNVADPYYLERSHYYDRPYPVTAPMFGDIPLVGPLAAATVGRLLKPPIYREYKVPDNYGSPEEWITGQSAAARMGIEPLPTPPPNPVVKWRLDQLTGDTLNKLFDWTGMPGFMIGAIKEQVTGKRGWFEDATLLASSDAMASAERNFYEKNLGGMLGNTEFLRRFITKGRRTGTYNPIENVAPEWLPGHRSVFPGDRLGYLDFHSGDPYTILEKGEARLPGAGYEALVGLHSGEHGTYDDFDRFAILADVAPFSDAFKSYKTAVQTKIQRGLLDKASTKRFYQTLDNLSERMESRTSAANGRYATGAFAEADVDISRVVGPSSFEVTQMPGVTFGLAGVKNNPYDMGGSQARALSNLQERMQGLVGQTVHMTWGGAGVETPAIIDGVNREAIAAGLESDRLTGLGYQAKHGQGGLPGLWESAMQMRLPSPLDYPRVKWLEQRSAVDEYEKFHVYGTADTGWSHPFRNYIFPWANNAVGRESAENKRVDQLTEYMDNVKFLKNRRLANAAGLSGDSYTSQLFEKRASQTLTALYADQPNFWQNIYAAMPARERPYFPVFAGTTSEEQQERILEAVPDYMDHIYVGLWKRKTPGGQFNSPILRRYAEKAEQASKIDADTRVAEFMTQHPPPDKSWLGWHPAVDFDAMNVKMAEANAIDVHQMGMWENQARQAQELYPELEGVKMDPWQDARQRDDVTNELARRGFEDIQARPTFSTQQELRMRFRSKRSKRFAASKDRFDTSRHMDGGW